MTTTARKRPVKDEPEAPVEVAVCDICKHEAHNDVATLRQCPKCACVAQDVAQR